MEDLPEAVGARLGGYGVFHFAKARDPRVGQHPMRRAAAHAGGNAGERAQLALVKSAAEERDAPDDVVGVAHQLHGIPAEVDLRRRLFTAFVGRDCHRELAVGKGVELEVSVAESAIFDVIEDVAERLERRRLGEVEGRLILQRHAADHAERPERAARCVEELRVRLTVALDDVARWSHEGEGLHVTR